jgi:hypothetical protein
MTDILSRADQVKQVIAHIQQAGLLGNRVPLSDEYYYAALPLCVVDAVFSIGVRYESTKNTVASAAKWLNWTLYSKPASLPRMGRTIIEFLARLDGLARDDLAREVFANRQLTSTQGGILKAEATMLFAFALKESGIDDFGDLTDLAKIKKARELVIQIPGQHTGISFAYFLMLGGSEDGVKPDRMVARFVESALKVDGLGHEDAAGLLRDAAVELASSNEGLTPRQLDYIVWNYQRMSERGLAAKNELGG